nr:hypothetical protein [Tanacetum cinerariifolium]
SSPFEELSDIGSPRADDHEYLMMLEDAYVKEESSEDDEDEEDDEMDVEANEEEEEEHP